MSGMWSCRWASQLVGSHHETASLRVQWTLESLLTLNLVPVTNLQYACTKTMSNCSRFPEQPPTRSPWVTLPDVSSHRNLRLYSLITKTRRADGGFKCRFKEVKQTPCLMVKHDVTYTGEGRFSLHSLLLYLCSYVRHISQHSAVNDKTVCAISINSDTKSEVCFHRAAAPK